MKTKKRITPGFTKGFFIILFTLFFYANSLRADNTAHFVKNIPLPATTGGGTPIQDLIYADGHIFAYAYNMILVFNATNNTIEDTIRLSHYGKFAPAYFIYGF